MILAEVMSKGLSLGLVRYGELYVSHLPFNKCMRVLICSGRWRKMRRAVHESLHLRAVWTYQPQQEWDAAHLLTNLLEESQEWNRHFKQ